MYSLERLGDKQCEEEAAAPMAEGLEEGRVYRGANPSDLVSVELHWGLGS